MKTGDMIEWTYRLSGCLVHEDETLWSTVEKRYVPIGSEMVHFLVSINDRTYSWLNAKGLFHALVNDSIARAVVAVVTHVTVVPRTRANLWLKEVE